MGDFDFGHYFTKTKFKSHERCFEGGVSHFMCMCMLPVVGLDYKNEAKEGHDQTL